MLLTIACPCYNVEAYLPRLLESAGDPRLAGLVEVLIIDDGSQDATARLAEEKMWTSPQVRVISQANAGHGGAVNTGLRYARGEYFRVVDGDDWINPEELLRELEVLSALRARGEELPDLLVDRETLVDLSTGEKTPVPLPRRVRTERCLPLDKNISARKADIYSLHNLSVRTRLLREARLHLREHCFYVDYQFNLFATARAHTVMFFDRDVYRYLIGNAAQSVSTANYVKRYDQHDRVLYLVVSDYRTLLSQARLSARRARYLQVRLARMARTQLNIALIFDPERARGRSRARALGAALRLHAPEIWKQVRTRYFLAFLLNFWGIDASALQRIKRALRR